MLINRNGDVNQFRFDVMKAILRAQRAFFADCQREHPQTEILARNR
jgi:hypothetical protein